MNPNWEQETVWKVINGILEKNNGDNTIVIPWVPKPVFAGHGDPLTQAIVILLLIIKSG